MATQTETKTAAAASKLPGSTTVTATQSASETAQTDNGSKTVTINLDIYSDNICPFCYLGYRKVQAAMEEAKKAGLPVTFSVTFKPFLLDPTLPCDKPISKKDRYAEKFGGRADTIIAAMHERGKAWGIDFSYGGSIRNTYTSHRLVEKARKVGGQEMQLKLIELLFAGYFEHEEDIGDINWLAEQAVEADVFEDEKAALEFLESNELKDETCSEIRKASALGITGVPFTVINNKYAVSGAQEPAAFTEIFKKIACGECPCKKS